MKNRRSTWIAAPHDAHEVALMHTALDILELEQKIDDIRERIAR